jgi:glycosyltransferase involved in cell wall biosynthesis
LPDSFCGAKVKRIPSLDGKHTETLIRSLIAALLSSLDDYDVIHYHAEGPGLFSLYSRLFGKKTVLTVQGLDWKRAKWSPIAQRSIRAAEQVGARFAHRIVVVSRTLERYFRETYGRDTIYIPNGVPINGDIPTNRHISSLGLVSKQYCLFASRLVPEKGCHELIEAYNTLKTGKKLVIAGSARYQEDYVDHLRKLARPGKVLFTGHVEGELLQELFANAYLFILPSQIEGLSNALLEALSHQICTLVSDIPENLEVIKDCGYSFRVGNVKDLAGKLRMLLDEPDAVRQMEMKIVGLLKATYSWDRATDLYEGVYASLFTHRQ